MLAREPKEVDPGTVAYHRQSKELVSLYIILHGDAAAAGSLPARDHNFRLAQLVPRAASLANVHVCSTVWLMDCVSQFEVLPPSTAGIQ